MSSVFVAQRQLLTPVAHLHSRRSSPYSGTAILTDYPISPPNLWAKFPSQVWKHPNRLKPVSCHHGAGREDDELTKVTLTDRRAALINVMLSVVAFPFSAGSAAAADTEENNFRAYEDKANKFSILVPQEENNFRAYEDKANKFSILVPQGWLEGAGESNTTVKSVTAFYPGDTSDSNVSIVITPVGPDFTRLESFGKVDEFAETLVNGLDRSWQRPAGLKAKLIDSKAANGLYYIEYTLQNPGDRKRHLISALGMASNGWYNRLYTVSGQFIEDGSEKYRPQIEKAVSSFRLIKDAS